MNRWWLVKDLKHVVIEELILALPYYSKPFEVHALDYNIMGMLMQDAYHIAYESYKLNDMKIITILYFLQV